MPHLLSASSLQNLNCHVVSFMLFVVYHSSNVHTFLPMGFCYHHIYVVGCDKCILNQPSLTVIKKSFDMIKQLCFFSSLVSAL